MGDAADDALEYYWSVRGIFQNRKRRKVKRLAKSVYKKFIGIASYAMLYKPDEYNDKRFWKINLHPTKEVIAAIKAAGLQNKLKDDTGNIPNASGPFFSFKRECEKEFSNGKTFFSPPEVLSKDGKKLVTYKRDGKQIQSYTDGERPEREGETILIGNGSEVEVTLEIYPTKRFGNGSRVASVRIIDLVEYNPDSTGDNESSETEAQEEVKVEQVVEKSKSDLKSKVGW